MTPLAPFFWSGYYISTSFRDSLNCCTVRSTVLCDVTHLVITYVYYYLSRTYMLWKPHAQNLTSIFTALTTSIRNEIIKVGLVTP